MDFSTFHYLVFFLGVFGGLFLSFWVYFSGKKEAINKLFSSMVLLWIIGEMVPYFIFRNISMPKEIIFFLPKLEIFFVFIFFIFFYFFSIKFLKEEQKFKIVSKIVVGVSLIGAFLAIFTNIFQKEVILTEGVKGLDLVLSPEGKIFWLGFVIIMTIFIFSRFVINYFKSEKKDKLRIQYFILGILSWIVVNLIFNVYFPLVKDTFKYAILGNYSILILFGFTAYAIIKRDLFGIKIVLTQTLVGIIAILLLVDVVASKTLFEYIWKGILFALFVVLGWLLIRSVLKEIKYREQIKEAYKREVGYRKTVKEAYEVEKNAHSELKRLDEAKTQFIMATQHHLRTPLTSMIGYLDLIF
ncbi:MAG: hypothetical protein U9Q16_01125, partial [Patescibacteria group bacterium]|nr:hypothetical protein [Patescibacteria group bacterium]